MRPLILPEEIYPDLFIDAAISKVLSDGKLLADAIPKMSPQDINQSYQESKSRTGFNLLDFIEQHFELLKKDGKNYISDNSISTYDHVNGLWDHLARDADFDIPGSSLIALPFKYVVPGGRFNEIYYWDSYFTMLGLKISGRFDLIESMLDNFVYLIDQVGFIPNGNRSYFSSRSQPPFFSMMVQLLVDEKGSGIYSKYITALQKEYDFWMEGKESLIDRVSEYKHLVKMDEGEFLNRYWDFLDTPRSEMYRDDVHLQKESNREPVELYKNLRCACESGWDFSSRWCVKSHSLDTINTSQILPVDLNCLMYNLEKVLSDAYFSLGEKGLGEKYNLLSETRKSLIFRYCWDENKGYFFDYHLRNKVKTESTHMAGIFPLSFGLCDQKIAERSLQYMEKHLLKPFGLVTTDITSGQQWDAPNGWAPLQWMGFIAALNSNNERLAFDIAKKWTGLNERVFKNTGKMMEKYNVQDADLESGGGEYPVQDGFGWTNGVYLALKSWLNDKE